MFQGNKNISTILIMTKKTSPLWEYFEEEAADPTFVNCKVDNCKQRISRGKTGTERSRLSNTGMRTHLMTHAKEWQEFLKKDAKVQADKKVDDEDDPEADETEFNDTLLFNLRTHKKRKSFFQQNLPEMVESQITYEVNDPRAKVKHQGILTMIITDIKPFNIVNDPGFLNFSKLLDPRFTVGSAMFYRRLLDKAYLNGQAKVQQKLLAAHPDAVSVQLDGWSQHHHGYMGLMVNYLTKDWKRAKLCLACAPFDQSHTGANVARWLEMECDKWGITDAVGVVTTDTAANMIKVS